VQTGTRLGSQSLLQTDHPPLHQPMSVGPLGVTGGPLAERGECRLCLRHRTSPHSSGLSWTCSWLSPTQAVARVRLPCGLRRIQLAVTLLDPSGAEMPLHHDTDMVRAIIGARQIKFLFGPARSQGQDTLA
jgi:hypothetical protein